MVRLAPRDAVPQDDPGKRVGVEDVGVGHDDGPVGLEVLTALLTGCLCMPRMAASVGQEQPAALDGRIQPQPGRPAAAGTSMSTSRPSTTALPPDTASEPAAFDGSVIAERTKGELLARREGEQAHFLALNPAHDLVAGRLGSTRHAGVTPSPRPQTRRADRRGDDAAQAGRTLGRMEAPGR
jgi:hypothetical protein